MKKIHFILISLVILLNACQKSDYLPIDDQNPKGNLSERLWMIKKVSSDIETKANAPMDKTWWPGQTIKIKFLNTATTDVCSSDLYILYTSKQKQMKQLS